MSLPGRPTRSRVSSPFVPTGSNGAFRPSNTMADGPQKTQTSLDRWVEPGLPPARPSYAEAGFTRGGTVANMAPLGALPSSKVMKFAARAEFKDGTERVRRSEASNATTPETPDPQPNAVRQRSLSVRPELAPVSPQTPRDQMSLPPSPQKIEERIEETIGEPVLEHEVAEFSHSPLQAPTARVRSSMSLSSPSRPHGRGRSDSFTPEEGPDGRIAIDPDFTDHVIESAVNKALDELRYPTAYALRTLYDELRPDTDFIRLIESVYHGRATADELTLFEGKLREKKKEGKKDRTGEYYFNGDGSDPAPVQRPLLSAVSAALTYDQNLRPGTARSFSDQTPDASIFSSASPAHRPREIGYNQFFNQMSNSPSWLGSANPPPKYTSIYANPPPPRKDDGPLDRPSDGPVEEPLDAPIDVPLDVPLDVPVNGDSTPGTQHLRSGSVSSSSSLSSMDDETLEKLDPVVDEEMAEPDAISPTIPRRRGRGKRGAAATPANEAKNRLAAGHRKSVTSAPLLAKSNVNAHNTRATSDNSSSRNSTPVETPAQNGHKPTKAQPIPSVPPTKHKTGPRIHTFPTVPVTSTSTSSLTPTTLSSAAQRKSTTNNNLSHDNGDMAPARLLSETVTNSVSSKSEAPILTTFKTKFQGKAKYRLVDENEPSNRKKQAAKQAAREKTNDGSNISESYERHQLPPPPSHAEDTASESGDVVHVPAKRPVKKRIILNTSTRETRNRYNHNDSENSSPTQLSFQPDLAPGSLSNSRAGTPVVGGRLTRKAKTGSGLRVKTSPVKKKGGIVAGIPRASGERNSPSGVGGGPSESKDDNDDYCAACGGNGILVCCDGCNRAFHFKCVDPPMTENSSSQDSWYCNRCEFDQNPTEKDDIKNATFGALLHNLKFKNPSAFHLPKSIRECFEGVLTGAEGEYEEPVPVKPKNRAGYDEAPDYFRTRDNKGKLIVCHKCNGTASAPGRMIIPCSFCSLYWHLDCLEFPMAKEPHVARQWRCPAHVNDIMDVLPAKLGPAHRWRKLKGAVPIVPTIPRGSKNNGHIEIEESASVDDEFFEESQFGTVHKLPELGVKLDFISKVNERGGGIRRSGYMNRYTSASNTPPFHTRSLAEQQTALNLSALARQAPDLSIDGLYKTLLNHAPPAVMTLITQVDSTAIANQVIPESDRQKLQVVQEWIKNVLAASPAVEEDEDDQDLPARKRVKTNNVTHENEDATMLL